MSGFTSPGTVGQYDFTAPEGQRWSIYQTTKVNGLNPEDFEAQQVRTTLVFHLALINRSHWGTPIMNQNKVSFESPFSTRLHRF